MDVPLGRRGVVGLAVAAAAGLSFITFITYRTVRRRRRQQLMEEVGRSRFGAEGKGRRPAALRRMEAAGGETLVRDGLEAGVGEAQALDVVEHVVHSMSPEHQLELRNQLDQVLSCVATLRSEVAELRGGLEDIALQIIQDVKKGVEDSQRRRRRRHFLQRERTDSTSSSSIYFTASQGAISPYEEISEGDYSTACTESDGTDRETDREEAEPESQQASDEEDDESCATVVTLRLGEEDGGLEEEEHLEGGATQQLTSDPSVELALLLAQSDILHTGDASLKAEGYRLLLDNKEEYEDNREFLWRLARAYRDMYESAKGNQEKVMYGQQGREEAEKALKRSGLNAECHKWFAVVTGLTTQHESLHGELKSRNIFKEHLDRAMALRKDDPVVLYLLGRWCYTMGAATITGNQPTAAVQDALLNFLKAEELNPGFSKNLRLYIAKCYQELNELCEASRWTALALTTNNQDNDEETHELMSQLQPSEKP